MPNGHGPKEYGQHEYADLEGRTDCEYNCGCWASASMSGGPVGLDPFGTCPRNPKDGKLLGGNADYEYVVTERIRKLESRVYFAEEKLKKVKPSKKELAEKVAKLEGDLHLAKSLIDEFRAKLV